MRILSKVFLSDQYLEETNVLIVNFSDGTTQAYDLTQPIPEKMRHVVPIEHYKLEIEFINGEKKQYDMSNRLSGVFSFLNDVKKFEQVKLIHDGKAVAWVHEGKNFDLWTDGLYFHSYPITDETYEVETL